ncbi:hypothetical protein QJQ45_002295 [Haematococcus lacustris]|nr:hypothetical protein QJQ45_002295 [Haematococcus lacustris]
MLARQGQPMQAFQPQAQQAVPTKLQPAQLFPMLQAPQMMTQASPTLALQGQPGRLLHLFQAPQNQTQRPQTPSGTQLIQPQPLPSPRQSSTTSQSQSGKENKRWARTKGFMHCKCNGAETREPVRAGERDRTRGQIEF